MTFFKKKLIKYSFIFFITITLLLSKASAEPTTNEGNFSITNENKTAVLFSFVILKLPSFVVGSAEAFDNNKVIVIKKIKEYLINFFLKKVTIKNIL